MKLSTPWTANARLRSILTMMAALVAPGVIYRIGFGVNDPPEVAAELEFTIAVGWFGRLEFDLTALVALMPHFTLDAAGFGVARGGRLDLACSGGVTPSAVTVTPAAGIAASIVGTTVRLDVGAAAATGPRTVLVTDQADATHKARRTISVAP